MKVFIGADHGGFELKKLLINYLTQQDKDVQDVGAFEVDPLDDYPDYAKKVAQAVLANEGSLGVVICRNGVGVDITVNRFHGIRCVLGFDETEIQKARQDDDVNVLALPADYVSYDRAITLLTTFFTSSPKADPKYERRIEKIDQS